MESPCATLSSPPVADHRPINRRAALLAGGALALAAGAPRTALGRSGDFAFDVRDPVANMEAAVRMMGSNDGSVTYGYNRGRLLGMRPREHARPLSDWEGCAARVFKRRDDGAFDLGLREWLYFLDMDTGEPATAMLNPYTLEEIQLTPFKGGGGLGHAFSTHGQGRSGRTGYEAEHGPYVYDWMAVGGLAHLQIDKFISFPAFYSPERFPRASTGSTRWEVQVQTLIGPIDELNDPGRPCVRTSEVWMMKNDWMGFMNMGQWSGHHIWRSQGRKALSIGELPRDFRERTEQVFPGLLAEVESWSA